MTELAILLVGLAVGFVIGWRLREVHARSVINAMFANMDKETDKPENVLNVEVVKENEQFYVYNAENNSFIVQVKTKEELFDYFKAKCPEKTVMMKKEHFALFDTVS